MSMQFSYFLLFIKSVPESRLFQNEKTDVQFYLFINLFTYDFVTCADNAINVSVPPLMGIDLVDTSGNSSGE